MKKALMVSLLLLGGCASDRMTLPPRAASEQLLISRASDAAALALHLKLPEGKTAYLKAVNFDGGDAQYALSAIRQSLLQQGNHVIDDKEAELIIEVRMGALSIDSVTRQIGLPSFRLAEILVPTYTLDHSSHTGVTKFSLFVYERTTGRLVAVVADVTGLSHMGKSHTEIGVISWIGSGAPPRSK